MENILVFPANNDEKTLLETLLSKMKIAYEKRSGDQIILSKEEIEDIEKGLEDIQDGNVHSSDEVRKMMEECTK